VLPYRALRRLARANTGSADPNCRSASGWPIAIGLLRSLR